MSDTFEPLVDRYRAALEANDRSLVEAIFGSVADADLDAFLDVLDSAGLDVPDVELTAGPLEARLVESGVVPDVAAQLSVIATGDVTEFVRRRAAAVGMHADTLALQLDEVGDIDELGMAQVHTWLGAALAGEDPPFELDEDASAALARLLDTTGATITSLYGRPSSE